MRKRFKSDLTEEFSCLAEEEGKSGELSNLLFGEDLLEKINQQIRSDKITKLVVTSEDKMKSKKVDAAQMRPFP